jgi:hypothetical protein
MMGVLSRHLQPVNAKLKRKLWPEKFESKQEMNEPQIVWLVGNKVWQVICATEEDAHTLIADLGMNTPSLYPSITPVQVIKYERTN